MKLTPLIANTFASDGGAMFGLVPKTLWEKKVTADNTNNIPQRANTILIEIEDKTGLVDVGCGNPEWFSERERAHHQLEDDWLLPKSLQSLGKTFEDIDFILLSHAHWDHAGALMDPDGNPVFPNAEIFLRQAEADCVTGGDPLLYKSYPDHIQRTFRELADRMFPVPDDEPEVLDGIYLLPAPGHTDGQAGIFFVDPEIAGLEVHPKSALFPGDNLPTQHHLRMVFQTAYDTYPLKTRAWKREWLPRIANDQTLILFTHDSDAFGGWIEPHDRHEFVVTEVYRGAENH
jgi:glyoxylase-like metal-dependent hydrolase (beta-lactamase superfamily II)